MRTRTGLTMIEVLISLVILGLIATLYAQTTRMSQKVSGKSMDWVQEGIVIERSLENLRQGHTLEGLRGMDSSWLDVSGQYAIQTRVVGSIPNPSCCRGVPMDRMARLTISARRDVAKDSVVITTFVWVP